MVVMNVADQGKFLNKLPKLRISCKEALRLGTCLLFLQLTWLSLAGQAQTNRSEALSVRDRIYKGVTLQNQHKFQAAIDEYEAALAMDPSSALAKENIVSAHIDWGNFYFRQKLYEDAESEWNVALKLNPYDKNAKRNLSILKATLARLGANSAAEATNAAANGSAKGAAKNPTAAGSASANGQESKPAGSGAETASGGTILPRGAQRAVEDNTPPPTAVIISPIGKGQSATSSGVNSSGGSPSASESSGAAIVKPSASSPSAPANGSMSIFVSTPKATSPISSSSSPSYSSTTTVAPSESTPGGGPAPNSSMNIFVPTVKPSTPSNLSAFPATPTSSAITVSSPSSGGAAAGPGGNLEEKLEAIEIKVYGRSQRELPIFQRLEKLERDTNSRVGSGSIADRLQSLIKAYGL